MQEIPKNVPKAPRFDSVDDLIKWYRKAYRIPKIKRKIKNARQNFVKDLRAKFRGTWKNTNIPSNIMKKGISSSELRNHLLDQLESSFDEVERATRKRVTEENRVSRKLFRESDRRVRESNKRIEKILSGNRQSNLLLRGVLARASGILTLLIPSSLDQENTAELPYPQNPFPAEDAQIEQQQLRQSTPRAGYYGGGIVQPTAPKTKRRKRKKTSWNY